MSRVIAYIDGFNLYHGMRERYGRTLHWLDVEVLCRKLIRPGQQLTRVNFFTAPVRHPVDSHTRQVAYLRALVAACPTVRIHQGRFQKQTKRCRSCGTTWVTYEEKESDVSLAVSLVEDAASDTFDTALLISADSDLRPAVQAVKRIAPAKRVVAVFPPHRYSDPLKLAVDGLLRIDQRALRRAQMSQRIQVADGIFVERPAYWA